MSVCVCVHTCVSMHIYMEAVWQLQCHPQEHCPSPLRQGLSLAWSSLIRLDWLASEPRDFPFSAFLISLLGLKVYTARLHV